MYFIGGHTGFAIEHSYEVDITSMVKACRSLEAMVMHIFANFGRRFNNRISY
jgi:hypothetical protein